MLRILLFSFSKTSSCKFFECTAPKIFFVITTITIITNYYLLLKFNFKYEQKIKSSNNVIYGLLKATKTRVSIYIGSVDIWNISADITSISLEKIPFEHIELKPTFFKVNCFPIITITIYVDDRNKLNHFDNKQLES